MPVAIHVIKCFPGPKGTPHLQGSSVNSVGPMEPAFETRYI